MDASRAFQIAPVDPLPVSSHGNATARALVAGVLVGLASLLTWHLSFFWEVNPQYSYGWVVPGLAIYLFLCRWQSRPYPGPGQSWT
jgi:hypothetical protein